MIFIYFQNTQSQEVLVYEGGIEDLVDDCEITISPITTSSELTPSLLPSGSTPSTEPDITGDIMITPIPSTSYAGNPPVKKRRKRNMSSDPLDEMMAKAIDKMENTWAEQSRLPVRFDMATEAVMSLMNHLASAEDLKLEFSVEVIELVARTLKKSQKKSAGTLIIKICHRW